MNFKGKYILSIFAIYLSCMYAFVWVTSSGHRGVLILIFILFFAYRLSEFCKKIKESDNR